MILKPVKGPFYLFVIFYLLMSISCQKSADKDTISDAIITGYDIRACVCCGGLMVNFTNDPKPYSGVFNLVNELPVNSGIDNNTKFPVYVKITWKYSTKQCGSTKFMDVLKIEMK
jgi:hypothetical protein